jgi:hypothetical protein
MRKLLYATTALVLGIGIAAAQTITPGSGSLTDASGNVWRITQSGSVMEGDQYTPGGGGTAALTIANGKVYGLDSAGKGWFTLWGRYWTSSAAPAGVASTAPAPPGTAPAAAAPAAQTATATTPATCAATPGGAASGGFTTSNGQIIAPDGSVYIAKGINLYDQAIGSASQVLADFPGINFIRLAAFSYSDTAAYLSGFISRMSAAHVVVEIEHHIGAGGGVPALTGSDLSAENQWFQALASAFKGNPYVWFGTINEPASGGGLAAEQTSNYQAIRSAGNNSIIMLSEPIDASTAGMTNVVIDQHEYGWTSGYSTDQATVTADLMNRIKADQQAAGGIPLIIGETGNSTDGRNIDANWQQVLSADMSSGYGAAFWNWYSEAPADNLTDGSGNLSNPYGTTVAGWIALIANAPASIWSPTCGGAPATTATSSASVTVAQASPAGTSQTAPTAIASPVPDTSALDATAAAQQAAAQAAIAAADAQAPANATAVQQANTAGQQADALLAGVLAAMQGSK